MKTILKLPPFIFEDLLNHLLPVVPKTEEAAFIFAIPERTETTLTFNFVEALALEPSDFVSRQAFYLELSNATRARVIKRAHDLEASLIELHSHVDPAGAAFSYSDLSGFKDIVPHIWWRLRGRPYAALVVAREGFDALVWADNPLVACALDELIAGDKVLRPTDRTLKNSD